MRIVSGPEDTQAGVFVQKKRPKGENVKWGDSVVDPGETLLDWLVKKGVRINMFKSRS